MNSYWAFYKDKILGFFFDSFFSFYTEEKTWTKNRYSTDPTGTPNFEPIVVLWAKLVFEKICLQILFKW